MKLYHEVRGCSLAVDIVARELQIPLCLQWVDMKTKTLPDGTDYFCVNSKGTVPTLELPDGQHLSEGIVIMESPGSTTTLSDEQGSTSTVMTLSSISPTQKDRPGYFPSRGASRACASSNG